MLVSLSYARFHPSLLLPSSSPVHQRPLLCRTQFLPSLGPEDAAATTLGGPWGRMTASRKSLLLRPRATLLESPVIWAGRMCVFYLLIKAGLAGSPSSPLVSDSGIESSEDYGFSKWLESWQGGSDDKEAVDRRKLVSKWHPTTKGTLRRSYRVPSKQAGQRLLKAVASLLSEDDHFVDATSHKGCQIRRETAHGESVCCNNVRALFDELPTPHLVVEITAFPAGPLTEKDYTKAEKLEKVLRSGSSI